ncbi:hypothetical protein [Corallococcus sp. CA047B]|uniref:hypothetical protein n=1 Tax=Corallococcus sp. CA047B TaxID=2316729 RepID=UPI0011C3E95C|nr:hypothetical protein [Corallococcus sp. CA047B]
MTTQRLRVQPFRVFSAEATRINKLYWATNYAYVRCGAMLELIERTAGVGPRDVGEIWPTSIAGEKGTATIGLPEFNAVLDENRDALRTTTVLYLCSAFENAVSGFYVLCGLKDPAKAVSTWSRGSWPAINASPVELQALQNALKERVSGKKSVLNGKYSVRLAKMESEFGLQFGFSKVKQDDLDKWYATRHAIAHDQGLGVTDEVFHSAPEILASRHRVGENDWKSLLDLFYGIVDRMDVVVSQHLGRDFVSSLAVARYLERGAPPPPPGDALRSQRDHEDTMLYAINGEWHVSMSKAEFRNAMQALGQKVSPPKALSRKRVSSRKAPHKTP